MNLTNFFNKRNIKRYSKLVKKIKQIEDAYYNDLTIEKAASVMQGIKNSTTINNGDKILHAMAITKKIANLTLGMSHYDVQLLGALALTDGCMAEMKTGEGKTLTCSAAVASNYVLGFKTHVATANDYLAYRDHEILKPLYDSLGISSASVTPNNSRDEKKLSYEMDVVYSTAQELGFDFLRDNLVSNINDKIQPNLSMVKAIIDEADFILIDEARTPLIISGESPVKNLDTYETIRTIALSLEKMKEAPSENYMSDTIEIPGDFWVEDKHKTVHLSDVGFERLEQLLNEDSISKELGITKSSLYHHSSSWVIHEILNALKAEYVFIRDKDYIIKNGEVVIIDQNTGRLSEGRTWSNGLHQAIETKEGLTINPETMTLGTISIQNYFRCYKNISGMSGTIMGSTVEFQEIYNTTTIQIPTNKPMIRKDNQDKVFLTAEAKYKSMISDIKTRHSKGQPILIGTTSVAESELVSKLLQENNIRHNVLNAKNNFKEAQIIAQAGSPYSVTVSTSMAGRGTDIILGGNKAEMLKHINEKLEAVNERIAYFSHLKQQMIDNEVVVLERELPETLLTIDSDNIHDKIVWLYQPENVIFLLNHGVNNSISLIEKIRDHLLKEIQLIELKHSEWKKIVLDNGGLLVLGSSRNESRRIDDQLRGRAGRQGDVGESVYYVSFEDPWVSLVGKNPIFQHLAKTLPKDEAIESGIVTKALAKAQGGIEGVHYTSRKSTFQYDSIADEGRRQYLAFRDLLITNNDAIKNYLRASLYDLLQNLCYDDILNLERFVETKYSNVFEFVDSTLNLNLTEIIKTSVNIKSESEIYGFKSLKKDCVEKVHKYVDSLINKLSDEQLKDLNSKSLVVLDKKWTEYLISIDDARQNVAFSGMAQKNPLHEFKKICFKSFNELFYEFGLDVIDILCLFNSENVELEINIEPNKNTELA